MHLYTLKKETYLQKIEQNPDPKILDGGKSHKTTNSRLQKVKREDRTPRLTK